jgi:hypothetical protein
VSQADPTTLWFHFLPDDGRLQFGRRRRVDVGTTLSIRGRPVLCRRGFHASARAIDALRYAPGALVCRVRLGGEIVVGDDKVSAQQRTVLWMADATRTLHEFACWAAEGALDAIASRGETVDPRSRRAIEVKRLWLDGQATDEELAAAWAAAWDAAWDAARFAAEAAARDAARAAAWAAAWDAARDAAWAAARDAAWAAAWVAARDAAWDAALDDMNAELERRLLALAPAGVSA